MKIWQMLFSLNGRIRRRDYWIFSLGAAIISTPVYLVASRSIGWSVGWIGLIGTGQIAPVVGLPLVALDLAVQYIQFCLAVKRLHDRDSSMAPAAAFSIISLAIFVVSGFGRDALPGQSIVAGIATLVQVVLAFWLLIACGFLDGTKGPNKYGPSPKYTSQAADHF